MKIKKFTIHMILAVVFPIILFQLTSCTFIEGFQFGKSEISETAAATSKTADVPETPDISDNTDTSPSTSITSTADDSNEAQFYPVLPADNKGMNKKIETENYIFYFNNTDEGFLNTYVKIAEDGNKGLNKIFGVAPDNKIEIYLCEELEEFKTVSDGILPPDFGGEPIGQSINGVVHIFKPEDFKPGPGNAEELLSYKIALLHEIGHAHYFLVYPDAARKNDWLNEALADKSITGENVDINSISNDYLKQLIANEGFIHLSELESRGKRTFGNDETAVFYEYISLVNFIALEFAFDALNVFIKEYNSIDSFLNSLVKATKIDYGLLEEQWLNAIMQ